MNIFSLRMGNSKELPVFLMHSFFLLLFINSTVYSQFNFVYNDSIPVVKNLDTLPLAWAGGKNHPQFSTIDLDFDGVEELVAFEPENGLINVYKRKLVAGEVSYEYWYDGGRLFPSDLEYKVKLVDYDGDGKKDIFTAFPGGIRVYKNISSGTEIQWELVGNPLKNFDGTNYTNIYSSSTEISAYYDIDGDGDIDVLTFNIGGVKSVVWNRNMSMETYGHADSLIFQLEELCWGEFIEGSSGNNIELHSTTYPCGVTPLPPLPNVNSRHQGGGSILALDINNDGLTDLIIGDHEYNNVTMVVNGGSSPSDNAEMVSLDADFPNYDIPIDFPSFIGVYYEDVDLDGVKDLIASSSELTNNTSENTKGVWLYKNNGTDTQPDFELKTKAFLQEDMIENGTGSIPVLVDVDNDGLIDLLVANDFNYTDDGSPFSPNISRINYYKNVGSLENPMFKLQNEDWNSFTVSGYKARISPAFGDLSGDGGKDMIIGLKNGKIYYYKNTGGTGTMNFNVVQTQLTDNNGDFITVSSNATPELFDLDNDGKLDLIVGQGSGPILYYRNVGTNSNFSFKLVNDDLGGIGASAQQVVVPRFSRANGSTYLMVGNKKGTLSFYDAVDGNIAQGDVFNLVGTNFLAIDTKGVSAPVMGQIRDDNSYDLFVGTQLGGLLSFRPGDTTLLSAVSQKLEAVEHNLTVYPNPNQGDFTLKITGLKGQMYNYRVLDPLGRVLISKEKEDQPEINVHLGRSDSGIYYIEITTLQSKLRFVRKFLVK